MISDFLYKKRHVNTFDLWMYETVCNNWEEFAYFNTKDECNTFIDSIGRQGFYNMVMEFVFMSYTLLNTDILSDPYKSFNTPQWNSMKIIASNIIHVKD